MLDETDRKIIEAVQKNGRVRRSDLAELVDLSLPAASDRLRKLEERGFITGYTALLDPVKFDKDVTAFVQVHVDTSRHYENFLKHVDEDVEILECHAITGEGTHLLKIRTTNTSTLEQVLSRIQSWKEVQRTRTSVVLSTRKETLNLSVIDSSTQP
ncbi:Lrp/AsnC family transcriptional regulator [bacterium]|nr:Lrp/AsnC family transcriptional regulator [bacterium]